MSDVKRLLEEATPLPWSHRPNHKPYHVVAFGKNGWRDGYTTADIERGDAALIVHAVNHLPDYEAAVDALERVIRLVPYPSEQQHGPKWQLDRNRHVRTAVDAARAALRRLRDEGAAA